MLDGADEDKIRARIEASLAGVRSFLLPDGVSARRAVAALVFITSGTMTFMKLSS